MVQREKRVKLLYELNLILWLAVFLGALNWRLQEVLWNEPTVETLIILLLLPVFAYMLLYPLLKRRLWPVVVFIIIASAFILTKYIGEIIIWQELVPGKEEFELTSFLVFLAFAGVELLTLVVGYYLHRKQSVWLLLVGAILVQMIIFSYFDRSFSVTVPLGIISALILQATIKVEEQPGSLRVSDGFGGRKPGKIMLPRRRRLAWTMLILVLAFYLGWNVPAFKAVWFQGTTREAFLDQVNDQINNLTGEGPIVTNDMIFSWNFTNPGRSWYPDDQQPLFYVQSSKPTYWRSQVFDVYSGSEFQQWAWYNF